MDRKYPDRPIVGVAGAFFLGDRVILVRRGQPPGEGRWSLPGGVVDLGETLHKALKREVGEELGVEVEIGGLIGVYERVVRDLRERIRYHYVLVDYWGSVTCGTPMAGSDAREARLACRENLDGFDLFADTVAAVQKAFELHAAGREGPEQDS